MKHKIREFWRRPVHQAIVTQSVHIFTCNAQLEGGGRSVYSPGEFSHLHARQVRPLSRQNRGAHSGLSRDDILRINHPRSKETIHSDSARCHVPD